MVEHKSQDLTEDEATLYDRQIRLWGLDSQKRLRAAKILVIGMKGLGAEICKNIILAGVKSLTMMDHDNVQQVDFSYQFLAPREQISKNLAEASLERARQLNPMVEVSACSEKVDDKPDPFFSGFDVICATQCTLPQIVRLNQICRLNGIKFFAGDIFGFFGYMFADLQIHEFSQEVKLPHKDKVSKDTPQPTVTRKDTSTFVPFQDLLDIDWTADEMASTFKKMSNGFFIMRVLQEFRKKEGHDPVQRATDLDLLKKTRDSVLADLKVDPSRVPDSVLEQAFGQVCPTCAIVGGVLAQEVIKAVSQRDRPHNNCFFFDPDTCNGKVECLGN